MQPDSSQRDAPWQVLFAQAVDLVARASEVLGQDVEWTLGGGTVLMLDLQHRRSKDIDVFLPHAQTLGLFNPRLSDDALTVTADYDESAGHIKLFLPQGEIDFVVAEPLTANPFHRTAVLGHDVLLERPAEIIAKKFWHRGNAATARDLFDLAAVAQHDPTAIDAARPFLAPNASTFLHQIEQRRAILAAEFAAIDRLDFRLGFDECAAIASDILGPLAR